MQKTKQMKIISMWFVSALLAHLDRSCAVSVLTSDTRVHKMIEQCTASFFRLSTESGQCSNAG